MNDEAFADAARPTPRAILRLPMLPYSIGHELILQAERNPLLAVPSDFNSIPDVLQRAAIFRAVLVCSRTWEENERCARWPFLWAWFAKRSNIPLAVAEFRTYRNDGSTCPYLSTLERNSPRSLGSPIMALLLNYAEDRYGRKAIDMPLGYIAWKFYAHLEMDGACNVENEQEADIRQQIEAHQEQYRREQAEKGKK